MHVFLGSLQWQDAQGSLFVRRCCCVCYDIAIQFPLYVTLGDLQAPTAYARIAPGPLAPPEQCSLAFDGTTYEGDTHQGKRNLYTNTRKHNGAPQQHHP